MSKRLELADIPANGVELNESDLALVSGGMCPELSSKVLFIDPPGPTGRDRDFE